MVSANERYVITYNGEVYSFQPIAAELAARGHKFRGHSDTEVILESFAVSGIEATLKRMIGMFAIALWDRRDRTLTLMRDRLGIKPLYWAKFGNTVPVRLRAQGAARASGLDAAHRSERGRCLHAAQLHSGAAHDL